MCERLDEARKQERETIAVSIEAPEDDCWVCEGLRSRRCDQNKHCPLDDIAAFIRASES